MDSIKLKSLFRDQRDLKLYDVPYVLTHILLCFEIHKDKIEHMSFKSSQNGSFTKEIWKLVRT